MVALNKESKLAAEALEAQGHESDCGVDSDGNELAGCRCEALCLASCLSMGAWVALPTDLVMEVLKRLKESNRDVLTADMKRYPHEEGFTAVTYDLNLAYIHRMEKELRITPCNRCGAPLLPAEEDANGGLVYTCTMPMGGMEAVEWKRVHPSPTGIRILRRVP